MSTNGEERKLNPRSRKGGAPRFEDEKIEVSFIKSMLAMEKPDDRPGIVYCLYNPAFINKLFKVGHTTNLEQRLDALYDTWNPDRFQVRHTIDVPDRIWCETLVKNTLADLGLRYNKDREYYRCELKYIKRIMDEAHKMCLATIGRQ